ncbi:response regulator transcription factor [Sphingobacterium chuzhouense]|uniref:Response regulator transcription factor n=1 Tax=Sphingobacterium chuzhouense TaxID=1742264 RepID=A0ABR7XXK0_9SPHI|nr:response regulator transcription factor [Sphingobacterium chuzhouense]MBD1423791.1 response regulator transcription factor [Sphingobacterium chuzhouense]
MIEHNNREDIPQKKYRLAIVEDRKPVLDTLKVFFGSSSYFDLRIAARSFEEFTEAWKNEALDVVLSDIGLPGKSGIETTWYIKRRMPEVQVVMFTVFENKEAVFQALRAGASGYLLKSTPLPQMEAHLMEVLSGGSVMSPQVARLVFDHFNPVVGKSQYEKTAQLTPREIEIMTMLQQGASYKEVASKLFVSVDTVKYHIRNIYQKLQVTSRAELILKYK